MPTVIKASEEIEAFYKEVIKGFQLACKKYPKLRNQEILATLGRTAGYCIAMCHEHEKVEARLTVVLNMDMAAEEVKVKGFPLKNQEGHA